MNGYGETVHSITIQEPLNFHEANKIEEWTLAMQEELNALNKNQTWKVTTLPQGIKLISCKWVYRIKRNPDGSLARYIARLIAKGYLQGFGKDGTESFAPVAKVVTVSVILAIAAQNSRHIHQLDINNIFLHGTLDEEIYLVPFAGNKVNNGQVCKLKKTLYELKQTLKQWYKEFSANNHCLFVMKYNHNLLLL